jgi:CheY-like chemotaxis protein
MNKAHILIADDDEVIRTLMSELLGETFQISLAADGTACLDLANQSRPDIVLLDVKMPGIDGYETCRRLLAMHDPCPPVLFISTNDRLEDKLAGYEAGGSDYILKPIDIPELRAKIDNLLKVTMARQVLQHELEETRRTALAAMSTLGETGVLLRGIQSCGAADNPEDIAEAVIGVLREFGLNGCVRIHGNNQSLILSTAGVMSPIETEVIDGMATLGRFIEFKKRFAINFENVTLLVSNAPTEDPDLLGRLRDHLMILVEAVNKGVLVVHRGLIIQRALQETSQALMCVQDSERDMHVGVTLALEAMASELERSFTSAALTNTQEEQMAQIVAKGIEQVRSAIQLGAEVLPLLSSVLSDLQAEINR